MQPDTTSAKRFVFFNAGRQYAVPIHDVLEVVQVERLLPAPPALPGCVGSIVHRNIVLPVFDPTALSEGQGDAPATPGTVVFIQCGRVSFGLAMEKFTAVAVLDRGARPDVGDSPADRGERSATEELRRRPHDFVDFFTGLPALESSPTQGVSPLNGSARSAYVEGVTAFRDNALVILSVPEIGRLVARNFEDQRILPDPDRADRADTDGAASATDCQSFLCARIERLTLGIPVDRVIEVIEGHDVTPLYRVDPMIRGLINLRGQVLACMDLSQILGLNPRTLQEGNHFVVLQGDQAEIALCVDKVAGIRSLPTSRFQKAESVLSGELTEYVSGVLEVEDETVFRLSVQPLFEARRLQAFLMEDE